MTIAQDDAARYWTTSVSSIEDSNVRVRGYELNELIGQVTFSVATYLLIRGELPTPEQTTVFDAVLTGVLDYGLEKPGTVAARYVYSANPNVPAGLATAVLGAGKNTLAPEGTAHFAINAYADFQASGQDPSTFAETLVTNMIARKERIPGLGHPVFRYEDPRAKKLKQIAQNAGLWGPRADLYETIHETFKRLSGKDSIPINDVGMMALILVEMGFSPEETTGLATISTLPGVLAHLSEEARAKKAIRIAPRETVSYETTERDFAADWERAGWRSR